jgi:hypothetical protein
MRWFRYILAGFVIGGFSTLAADGLDFFEKKIRPVLVERCYKCHSAEAKGKLKGGLRLDLRAAIRLKGDSGVAGVVPGNPKTSQLLNAISYLDAELQMPPKNRLPKRVVDDFREWIKMGAPDPRDGKAVAKEQTTIDFTKAREFWSFQPIVKPRLPAVKNKAWVKSPLDQFILAHLEKSGFAPAPQADLRTLIRRMTYDLTGLPPTTREIETFLADKSPDAFAKLIDRLLASPRYGEKWGRHWLDVARYADSNGLDENLAYINAFRYRNWVINAFNADLPYDQFVREQIAGDLLPEVKGEPPAAAHARAVATGFFCVGPKMLAEDDPRKMQMDIIDEQLDTLGRTFMGMTIGCARCHDHKFDPIPTRDYYALAGIFKSTKTMENHKVVAVWHEREINTPEMQTKLDEFAKIQKTQQTAIDKLIADGATQARAGAHSRAADYLLAATIELIHEKLAADAGKGKTDGARVIEAEKFTRGTKAAVDLKGYGKGIGILGSHGPANVEYDITLKEPGAYLLRVRYAAKDARPSKLLLNGALLKKDFAGKTTGTWYPDTQRYFDEGIHTLKAGVNTLKLDCPTPFPHIDKLMLVPVRQTAGLVALRENSLRVQYIKQWVKYLKKTAAIADSPLAEWHALAKKPDVAKAKSSLETFRKKFANAKKDSPLGKILHDPKGPFATAGKPEQFLSSTEAAKLAKLRADLKKLEATKPKPARAMTLTESKPENLKVHLRGDYLKLGEAAPRGFLRVAGDAPAAIAPKASGRLELARWLTRPDHPLTARVMANRLWLWHFGEGLVRSPDNFGKLGQRPTHPALLDWLATQFITQGWSIKKMHRLIMLSDTYQMSSQLNKTAAAKDPANKLWWRFNRRRLLAEEIRDTLLAIDGTLEHGMQQQLMTHKPREYVTSTGFKNVNFDFKCRSVYVPVIRSAVYPVMSAFDFGDPAIIQGQRASTVVAPQALFMMNDELVLNASQRLAARAMKAEPPQRVQQLYQTILHRPPTAPEQKRALDFIQRLHDQLPSDTKNRDQRAWQALARVLFASNEFMFVD